MWGRGAICPSKGCQPLIWGQGKKGTFEQAHKTDQPWNFRTGTDDVSFLSFLSHIKMTHLKALEVELLGAQDDDSQPIRCLTRKMTNALTSLTFFKALCPAARRGARSVGAKEQVAKSLVVKIRHLPAAAAPTNTSKGSLTQAKVQLVCVVTVTGTSTMVHTSCTQTICIHTS